ncbi:MAG TPA: metalloregulator ArsR/SmtB family transcription factor [Thermomicrobiales bacterium]|jgi:biotin operon repressor|nr:metalloregulator ArsR/SmtB family transcription factor [Thermomicrobiales bacterium]
MNESDKPEVPADRYEEIARAFRVLSDPMRLRILGLIAGRPMTGVEIAAALSLSTPTVSHHMTRLEKAGLIRHTADRTSKVYELQAVFFDPQTLGAPPARRTDDGQTDDERFRARTLRSFFDGRRLRTIPAKRKQLVIVIQELLTWFEPDRDYAEREVNDILREAHEDVATLRRELVDYGYMRRAAGIYRVATALPERSVQLRQEMTGDEGQWLARLLADATRDAITAGRG